MSNRENSRRVLLVIALSTVVGFLTLDTMYESWRQKDRMAHLEWATAELRAAYRNIIENPISVFVSKGSAKIELKMAQILNLNKKLIDQNDSLALDKDKRGTSTGWEITYYRDGQSNLTIFWNPSESRESAVIMLNAESYHLQFPFDKGYINNIISELGESLNIR